MRRQWLACAVLPLLMAALGPMAIAEAGQPLVGIWLIRVHLAGQSLLCLTTISADGTYVEFCQGDILLDLVNPAGISIFGPQFGLWEKRSGQKYDITHYGLLQGRNGELVGVLRNHANLNYNRETDSISGHFTIEVLDADGNVLFPVGEGPYTGSRQPLVSGN